MELVLLEEQDMALRNEDRAWIAQEIRTSMQEHLHPHGWRRVKEWIPVGTIIAIMVALLALAGAGWNYGFSRMRDQATFEAKTTDRLEAIERALRGIRTSQDLREISKLDQSTFVKSLPALKKALDQPPSGGQVPREALKEVAEKLRKTDPDSVDYWPTTLRFLNVASAYFAPDVPPPGPFDFSVRNNSGLVMGVVNHKRIVLDGGELINTRFENSRIIFTNNPVKLTNVLFVDCAFEIPVTASPNDYLKRASQVLLASDLSSISFSSE